MISEFGSGLLGGSIACLLGLYALVTGWVMIHSPDKIKPMYYKLAVGIAWLFQGSMGAERKEAELMTASRIRQHGYLRALVGGGLFIGGVLQLLSLLFI